MPRLPALLPQPQKLTLDHGSFALPATGTIGICCQELHPAAAVAAGLFRRVTINIAVRGVADTLTLAVNARLKPGGYRLRVSAQGVRIEGQSAAAVAYGVQTLRQLAAQASGGRLPCLRIDDWPDFADRGVYYDVCRGRMPKLEELFQLADNLARYKINQLQLYIEHTFAFRGHPKIGKGASPLTAEDILALDAFCAGRGIELVPSLASFGHLSPVLSIPEYRHLAEDWGIGKFVAPKDELPAWFSCKAWTLSPANPDIYPFLDSLFAEFLPLFRSPRFNICCDETWDLGLGQSYALCKKLGKGVVYLNHIKKVRNLCRKYGKKVMFWGDIIRHHPELIKDIPKDVTVLDWGYGYKHPFDRIKDFKKVGLPFYACPGTSSWVSLFPRLPEAMANIAGFAAAGHKYGARGLLNTDWGDGGHYNFMEFSWHGYLFGAEQGWNTKADQASFTARFAKVFFNSDERALVDAINTLGEVSHLGGPYYQSIWQHVFFAAPGDKVLSHADPIDMSVANNGTIAIRKQRFDAKLGREHLARLVLVRQVLVAQAARKDGDPAAVLDYWIFALDTIAHAARKLTVLGSSGRDTKAARQQLKQEQRELLRRFQALWFARNRTSEIRVTLERYRQAIKAL